MMAMDPKVNSRCSGVLVMSCAASSRGAIAEARESRVTGDYVDLRGA